MQGIYYLLSIVAVLVVIIWYFLNDKNPEGQPTRGLLAMKTTGDEAESDSVGGKEKQRRRKDKWRRPS